MNKFFKYFTILLALFVLAVGITLVYTYFFSSNVKDATAKYSAKESVEMLNSNWTNKTKESEVSYNDMKFNISVDKNNNKHIKTTVANDKLNVDVYVIDNKIYSCVLENKCIESTGDVLANTTEPLNALSDLPGLIKYTTPFLETQNDGSKKGTLENYGNIVIADDGSYLNFNYNELTIKTKFSDKEVIKP